MSWAHSEVVRVTDNGGLYPYPCLDRVTDARFKSVANGGQCETSAPDLAYYDSLTGALLPFDKVVHNLTTGEIVYWVYCAKTQGTYVRKWGDATVTVSLEDKPGVWVDYVSTPSVADAGFTQGFVGHFNDNAADAVVKNACGADTGDATFFAGTTASRTTVGDVGPGLTFAGVNPDDLLSVTEIIHRIPDPNPTLTLMARFKLFSLPGQCALIADGFFAETGYFFGISAAGYMTLAGLYTSLLVTGTTPLELDTWYRVTGRIKDGVGILYIGRTVEGSGPIENPGETGNSVTNIGSFTNSQQFHGVLNEVRISLNDIPLQEIASFDPCEMTTAEVWGAIRVKNFAATPEEDDDTFTTYLFSEVNKPRPCLLDPGTVSRKMSDLLTGTLSPTTVTITLADADHYWDDIRRLHGGSLKDAECWLYLTSSAARLAGGAPRLLHHGFVSQDVFQAGLITKLDISNPIGKGEQLAFMRSAAPSSGSRLSMKIPQRVIRGNNTFAGTPLFPNWSDPNLGNPRAVPFTLGPYSDVDFDTSNGYVVGGIGPAICLNEYTMLDASTWVLGLVSGHDHKDGILQLYQPVDATDVGLIPDNDPDAKWPGQTTPGWATINPSGAVLYTDLGTGDEVERFTLFAVKGDRAAKFKDGSGPIYFNVKGPTDTADGLGTEMTEAHGLKPWALNNWILRKPGYLTGAYYSTPPAFDFFPGGSTLEALDMASMARSLALATAYGGITWSGIVGANGDQQELDEVIASLNRSSFSALAYNHHGQLTDCMFDFTRATFLRTTKILDAICKRGIVAPPSFFESVPFNYFVNDLSLTFAYSYRTNKYEGGEQQLGSGGGHDQFGPGPSSVVTLTLPFVADPDVADRICGLMLALYSIGIPSISNWARTWCGLEDDIGDGRAITHRTGQYQDDAHWIIGQVFAIAAGQVRNEGLYVEPALT